MGNAPKKIKMSPFSHLFKRHGNAAVYNSLNHSVFYGEKDLSKFLEKFKKPTIYDNSDQTKKLLKKGILVSEDFDSNKCLKDIKKPLKKPLIDSLYIITTDKCNYACKYCFVEGSMPKKHSFKPIGEDVLKRGINLFARLQSENKIKESEMIFYGGEPLLNKEAIFSSINHLDEKVKTKEIKKLNKMIFTNGSLVSKEIADFFYENEISVGISIDGWKELHNKMRILPSREGTFDETIKGYKRLKSAGCHIGISCTVSTHNIDVLDKVVEYFATDLEGKFISLNPLFDVSGQKRLTKEFLEHMADKIIAAYDVSKKYGIYEDRITKFIEPFVRDFLRLVDCAACGKQMVLSPDGQIGPCHAFLGNKKFFCGSVYEKDFDPNEDEVFKEWSTRSPFNIPKCQKCPALSICGGGCPYNSYVRKGSIWKVDDRICYLAKKVLEKIIWEGFENVKKGNKPGKTDKTGKEKLRHLGFKRKTRRC